MNIPKKLRFIWQEVVGRDIYGLKPLAQIPFKIIIDIGGNIGAFAVHARSLFPESRIISVEPGPEAFKILCENASGLNIETHKMAMGNGQPLYHANRRVRTLAGAVCSATEDRTKWRDATGKKFIKEKSERVISARLSDMLNTWINGPIEQPSFLKIDCEGGERYLLNEIEVCHQFTHIAIEYHKKICNIDSWFKQMRQTHRIKQVTNRKLCNTFFLRLNPQ